MRSGNLLVIVTAVVSVALCTPLFAADPIITPPVDRPPAAFGPEAFSVEVDRITSRRMVRPPGKSRAEYEFESVLDVELLVSSTRPDAVLGMRLDPIVTATTDAGEAIRLEQQFDFTRVDLGPLMVIFSHPKRPADALAQLAGTVTLHCETAPAKAVELKPTSAWLNKPMSIAGGTLPIVALAPELGFRLEGASKDSVKTWEFLDATGAKLAYRGRRSSSDDKVTNGTYALELPADGSVTMTPLGPTIDIIIPFTFRNILLNPPPAPAAEKPLF